MKFLASEGLKFTLTSKCPNTACVSQELGQFRSRLECASHCRATDSCVGFSYASDGVCRSFQDGCIFGAPCTDVQHRVLVYEKEGCKNSARWNNTLHICECVGGWV
ncbi:unnamed protein product, partial [Candidula unifasciata]